MPAGCWPISPLYGRVRTHVTRPPPISTHADVGASPTPLPTPGARLPITTPASRPNHHSAADATNTKENAATNVHRITRHMPALTRDRRAACHDVPPPLRPR